MYSCSIVFCRLGDALIAQSCIDQGIPLITRDRDFHAFTEAAKLNLVVGIGLGSLDLEFRLS